MKIPETSANVGAYYGNEENGQWQPNGVIIDSGVGGGVVGSGDAGMHRPPVYPVHLPRGHMPGFVMAGAYYPPTAYPPVPPPVQDDFADYMWMENEEEFDKQVMQQLEEEALMEQCIEAMLEDEQRERHNCPTHNGHNNTHYPTTSNGAQSLSLEETVSRSTLNPLAAEFVPTRARAATSEERQVTSELVVTAETLPKTEESPPEHTAPPEIIENAQMKTEEPLPPQKDPPEVAFVDIPQTDKPERPANKDMKKETTKPPKADIKKPTKTDVKVKAKPLPVKSETKMLLKKKEVKEVKSEVKIEEKPDELPTEAAKVQSAPVPTSAEETQPSSGFKPINYAAAAKANKPKKPIVQQTTDKSQTPATKTVTKEKAKIDKVPAKSEKVLQRKNSAK